MSECIYKSCNIHNNSGTQCTCFAVYEKKTDNIKVYEAYALLESALFATKKDILLKVFSTKDGALSYVYELLLVACHKMNRFKEILM